jgi:hypothetical protein
MKTTRETIYECRNHCLNTQVTLRKGGGYAGVLADSVADVSRAKFLFNWIHNIHLAEGLTNTVAHHAEK